ncbi:LOW QUALITY PROTEIN: hypothetical protein E2986_12790 [Frieseomelitta varia]|uniref:Uncharacterized protein n=1 Tax=Frieseomelitta varia TaxID=561572 RepID=A0A833S1X3_9HYME|nr:LOW QUALITY PROTEIN: hypothetical protein E2986_12790 [Frieseomelitta varia]
MSPPGPTVQRHLHEIGKTRNVSSAPTIRGQQRSSTNSLRFIARQIAYRSISTQDCHRRRQMDHLFQTMAVFKPRRQNQPCP